MPSPCPGIDPYLEDELFHEVYERLANQISVELMPQIRRRYVALLAKRYVLDRPAVGPFGAPEQQVFYPDVHADVVLDLQRAADACFAPVRYDLLIDDTQPPPPVTSTEDLAWIDERLRATGARPV